MPSLPRYRRSGLRPVGQGTMRKASRRRQAYAVVARRAKGICEIVGCGRAQDPLDPHHTFGRGHLPGIPAELCDSPELILGICRPCHDAIHGGDEEKRDLTRLQALQLFGLRWGFDVNTVWELAGPDPIDAMRAAVELRVRR